MSTEELRAEAAAAIGRLLIAECGGCQDHPEQQDHREDAAGWVDVILEEVEPFTVVEQAAVVRRRAALAELSRESAADGTDDTHNYFPRRAEA